MFNVSQITIPDPRSVHLRTFHASGFPMPRSPPFVGSSHRACSTHSGACCAAPGMRHPCFRLLSIHGAQAAILRPAHQDFRPPTEFTRQIVGHEFGATVIRAHSPDLRAGCPVSGPSPTTGTRWFLGVQLRPQPRHHHRARHRSPAALHHQQGDPRRHPWSPEKVIRGVSGARSHHARRLRRETGLLSHTAT